MKNLKKIAVSTGILSAVALSGCASNNNEELIKQQGEKINALSSQMNSMESELKGADSQMATAIRKLEMQQQNLTEHVVAKANTYAVQEGDTLLSISRQFNTTLEELVAKNPQVKNPNLLLIGHIINL
ncbi:LysM peptidoglycan-binding domain-containing protein [Vibrio vulnificus]|uniref:LysM peptidoglycan-binding domain-containing protein n=1 Tax=Vibrio vulnificus TaxID=672 RepID=UPI001029725C|nr:LysM peptidoglycan-binding domain-containing protein [Vibrio vulnificus]RZP95316.1 LysM domain-containing protein [Vibrio vulnificus]